MFSVDWRRWIGAFKVTSFGSGQTITVVHAEWFGYDQTMKDGPDIARVAALIGDPARANMLAALMDGRALTATELASVAGVGKATASGHLSKLEAGGLVRPTKQGRHRYFSLTGPGIAEVLEALMGLAQSTGAVRVRTGPRDQAMRQARVCYDHLAGEMGVALMEGLLTRGALAQAADDLALTDPGRVLLTEFGLDLAELDAKKRRLCRPCLDWSMRRDHLAGALGAALWQRIQELGWAARVADSRAVRFTPRGAEAFRAAFGPV